MKQSELEQQAKEYGMTVSEIKEYRKHIIPFLKFAIDGYKKKLNDPNSICILGLCCTTRDYTESLDMGRFCDLSRYLDNRLQSVAPVKTIDWWPRDEEVNKQRIKWCRQQLKLVKP